MCLSGRTGKERTYGSQQLFLADPSECSRRRIQLCSWFRFSDCFLSGGAHPETGPSTWDLCVGVNFESKKLTRMRVPVHP
ncbi:unnamed protein product [Allacma fusca]|uniref:Uncharacterized protein n=1 Tax=Allacma fusca TaxID=39272 RepID=A0A8J2J3S5_9HEXA|nr:unnamed protein product [Allacma fusca]